MLNPIDLREEGFQSIAKCIAKSNPWALKKDLNREEVWMAMDEQLESGVA